VPAGWCESHTRQEIEFVTGLGRRTNSTISELFIYEEPALTHIYECTHLKPVEAGVLKEKINYVKDKKG